MKVKISLCLLVFGAISLFNFSTAMAENCSAVDLTAEMGPIRNQGDIGWCYANAAADLLSFRYKNELKGQQVSALYTALLFNKRFYDDTFVSKVTNKINQTALPIGGSIGLALKTAIREGFCPRSKDDAFVSSGQRISLEKKLRLGLTLKELYDQRKTKELWRTVKAIRASNSLLNEVSDNELTKTLEISTHDTFLKNLAELLCEGAKFNPKSESDVDIVVMPRTQRLGSLLFRKMDSELSLKRPVGVGYFATIFDGFEKPIEKTSAHASVVVGREMRATSGSGTVQCHYKLRNSWGSGCNYKNPAFKGEGCEAGYLWVPKDQFKRYLYGVVSIQPD